MPGYLSHYMFSIGTAKRMQDSTAYPVLLQYKRAFCLGGEGPDIFLYYLPTHLLGHPSLGHRLHKTKTMEFIRCGINNLISLEHDEDKKILYAYLSGILCHYTFDSTAHPYVEGFANSNRASLSKLQCSSQHCSLETTIDTNLLFKYLKKFPSEQNFFSITNVGKRERKIIATFLTNTCNAVYKDQDGFHETKKRQMVRVITMFPYLANSLKDKTGIKKPLFALLEKLLHLPVRLSCVISCDCLNMNQDVLNLKHKDWASPYEPRRIRRDSFIDIFEKGVDCAYKRCQLLYSIAFQCDDYSHRNYLIQLLLEDVGNLSYNTGLALS